MIWKVRFRIFLGYAKISNIFWGMHKIPNIFLGYPFRPDILAVQSRWWDRAIQSTPLGLKNN